MSGQPPPPGGAFLAQSPALDQVSTPEEVGPHTHLMARTARDFVHRRVAPVRARLEGHDDRLARELMAEAGALGLLAGNIPAEYGGLGLPKTTMARLGEAMAGDLSFAVGSGIHAGVALLPLVMFGTDTQKTRRLPPIARGDTIGAFALSEANAGSDALSARTRAVPTGDGGYVLHGVKQWITNAGFADLFTVFAQVDGTEFTAFLVERDTAGVSLGPEEDKMGLRGSSTRRLILDGVRVPAENVLGAVGQGHKLALGALNPGRFAIAVTALGSAKDALGHAARYAGARRQFGRTLGEFGLTQHALGGMAAQIYALESMVYRAAGCWDRRAGPFDSQAGEEYAAECALLKFWGTEAQGAVIDGALQIHGGYGFSESYPVARAYRDARVFRIFEGTNEVVRLTLVDQVLRRIKSGRLVLPDWEDIAESPSETGAWVANLRRATLYVLALLRDVFGEAWREQQEIAAALGDMMAALSALESAALRAAKHPQDPLAPLAVRVLACDLCAQAHDQARLALAALSSGDLLDRHARQVASLLAPPLRDTFSLRRQLARAVLDCGGYPWG